MASPAADRVFSGSVADVYDSYLVPLIFEPYAQDIASRVAKRDPRRVLEVAAGTGVATRALALALPRRTVIVATDLNQPTARVP
jgi:predicted O-methyltransferase YrrM